jgi:hypothetical protein
MLDTFEVWGNKDLELYGVEFFLSDPMLANQKRAHTAIQKCSELVSHSLAKKLFEEGFRPLNELKLVTKKDDMAGGWLSYLYAEGKSPALPEQYLYKAWLEWQDEHIRRLNLENLSLWGYLKHWWRRKFKPTGKK